MSDIPHKSGTCNWEYIVQIIGTMVVLKVRPLNTVFESEWSKPLLFPIERNDIDFRTIGYFSFDLTNSCNLRCQFCYSSPQSKSVKLTDFDYQVICGILHNLKKEAKLERIQIGCDFEPLVSTEFESYAKAFKKMFKGPHAPLLWIATNGIPLDPDKIQCYSKAVGKNLSVRISFHSHKKEVFESYIKGLNFDRLVNNIIDVRRLCPDVHIELCNVLTKLNFADIPEYLDYVCDSLKVDIVHFRRPSLWHLSDDKRAKLELEPGKFAELHDWLSSLGSYNVSTPTDYNWSEFTVRLSC